MIAALKKRKYVFFSIVLFLFIFFVFVYSPAADKDETILEAHIRGHENLVEYQTKHIFNYIRTAIHEELPKYTSYLGHLIDEKSSHYYWNTWEGRELIAHRPMFSTEEDKVIVKFESKSGDGYIIFKQGALEHPMSYCGRFGWAAYMDDPLIEVLEFRKNEEGDIKEYQTHQLGYSETYRHKECDKKYGSVISLTFKTNTLFERIVKSFKHGDGS